MAVERVSIRLYAIDYFIGSLNSMVATYSCIHLGLFRSSDYLWQLMRAFSSLFSDYNEF